MGNKWGHIKHSVEMPLGGHLVCLVSPVLLKVYEVLALSM